MLEGAISYLPSDTIISRMTSTNLYPLKCHRCGHEKKETNHWFILWALPSSVIVRKLHARPRFKRQLGKTMIVCGDACLVAAVSEWAQKPVRVEVYDDIRGNDRWE